MVQSAHIGPWLDAPVYRSDSDLDAPVIAPTFTCFESRPEPYVRPDAFITSVTLGEVLTISQVEAACREWGVQRAG